PGDYFWTVLAYDKNRHIRYARSSGSSITHFRVQADTLRPDLTINICTKKDTVPRSNLTEVQEILESVHFDLNSDILTEESENMLKKWADFINNCPGLAFEIAGYADPTGPYEYNLQLSQRRAESVKRFLSNQGVDSNCLIAKGFGETAPADKHQKEDVLANDRRVELKPVEYYLQQRTQCATYVVYSNNGHRTAEDFSVTVYNSTDYDSSEFQPKLLPELLTSKHAILPDTMLTVQRIIVDTTIAKLEPGERDSIKVTWDMSRPYMVAWIDKENLVDEEEESNNRDTDRLSLPDLEVSHRVSEFIVQGGDTVKYQITITNHGPGPAQNFSLLDVVPDSLTTFDFSSNPDSLKANRLFWKLDSLAVGDSMTISFSAKVVEVSLNRMVAFCNKVLLHASCDIVPNNNVSSTTMYASMINFDFNKATLRDESKQVLIEVARNLKNILKENPEKMFEVAGHASLEPWVKPEQLPQQKVVNLKLSQQRANSVKNFLVEQGVDCWRMIARGYGHERPKYNNNEPEGLVKNRRVEIKPYPQKETNLQDCE
ncbi:MAG: OmpA family protein, partial [bacterium]